MVAFILALSLAAPRALQAGYYCDQTNIWPKYSAPWYLSWAACVVELIMESEEVWDRT